MPAHSSHCRRSGASARAFGGPLFVGVALLACGAVSAQTSLPWSDETHAIAFGDFNGDGKTDLLYIPRASGQLSGVALSNNAGPHILGQTWSGNHLGIEWSGSTFEPIAGDFNGDGRADVFLQRKSPGDHYVLLASAEGRFTAINQSIPSSFAGQIWSADSHRIVAGDFNGDGRADLFLQASRPQDLNAVFLANAAGMFDVPQQTWGNAHLGFKWSLQNAVVQAADFDGDGKADLFVQARPDVAIIGHAPAFPVSFHPPGRFGIANARAMNGSGQIFFAPALQIWDRVHRDADWSAANFDSVVGDFSGDGKADILLQSRRAGIPSAEFVVSASGTVTDGNVLTDPRLLNASADRYRLHAANFDGTAAAGVYLQAIASGGSSEIAWNSAAGSWTERYAYDALGRLRQVTFANGAVSAYAIDKAGNRTSLSSSAP